MVNWPWTKFLSLKFYWHNFCLHQLERKIHINDYIWHLQGMMACFDLTSCSRWGSLESGHQTHHLTMVQFNSNLTLTFDYSRVFTDLFESLINDHVLFECNSCSIKNMTHEWWKLTSSWISIWTSLQVPQRKYKHKTW